MKATILTSTVLTVILSAASFATAQSPSSYVSPKPITSPSVRYRHASTYTEGALRGAADFTRAAGESRYNSSLAMINREEATRRSMENRKQYAKDFFELRKLNKDARFQSVRPPTQQQLTRASKVRLPQRLSAHEFQPALGTLNWPAVLQRPMYAQQREAINQTMAQRTVEDSGLGSQHHRQIGTLVAQLENKLRGELKQLSTSESIAARKFLKSVHYEARFPVTADVSGLALK